MVYDLRGRASLVTGAGYGIGKAISLRLAEEGREVAVFDLDLPGAEETVTQIRGSGVRAKAVRYGGGELSSRGV